MKRFLLISLAAIAVCGVLIGCSSDKKTTQEPTDGQENEKNTYKQITQAAAKELMDSETGYIILDVRTQAEFDEGHIKGAILIPDYDIKTKAEGTLQNKDQLILVYCRSGRRSKIASEELVKLGYTNVKEFGGIIDWKYEIVK